MHKVELLYNCMSLKVVLIKKRVPGLSLGSLVGIATRVATIGRLLSSSLGHNKRGSYPWQRSREWEHFSQVGKPPSHLIFLANAALSEKGGL